MEGKHKIEVRSGRVVFTIEQERNITILRGNSATGKTTLVEMLQAYETYGRQSSVTVSCDMTRQNCRNSICRKKIWRRSLWRWSKAN